jgi:CRP-like cAMP-binding protein
MAKATKRRIQPGHQRPPFDAEAFLESAGAEPRTATYPKGKTVFSQGQPSDAVMYIHNGGIKISVLSRTGKEAVVAMLGPGDFFGEGALTGQPIRIGTTTAMNKFRDLGFIDCNGDIKIDTSLLSVVLRD